MIGDLISLLSFLESTLTKAAYMTVKREEKVTYGFSQTQNIFLTVDVVRSIWLRH
jgi:hypothetical protein